jgi:adenosine deaminase
MTKLTMIQKPKIELHCHLEASFQIATLKNWVLQDTGKSLSMEQLRKDYLITEPMSDLKEVLRKFTDTRNLLHSPERIQELTADCLQNAIVQGIKGIELRFSLTYLTEPRKSAGIKPELEGHNFKNWEKILNAVSETCKKFENKIEVGLIFILQRTVDLETNKKVFDFFLQHRDYFVGLDLADDELYASVDQFENFFNKAKKLQIPFTIHAGEVMNAKGIENMKYAVQKLGARRIGHGIACSLDSELLDLVIKNKVHLEICPSSNVIIRSVKSLSDHPIKKLIDKGVSVSLNSDDPGIFDYSLSQEFDRVFTEFNFSEKVFDLIYQNALQASFLKASSKKALRGLI